MKNLFFFLAIPALLISGCKKNIDEQPRLENEESILQRVSKLGFDTTDVYFRGDTVIVEGDIAIDKAKLFRVIPRQSTTHIGVPALSSVNVYVSTSYSTADRAIILDALNEFSIARDWGVGRSTMTVNIVTNPVAAHMSVIPYYEVSGSCGFADFPAWVSRSGGPNFEPGRYIMLNTYQWDLITSSQKKRLVAHEFGHTIGLRHTNWRSRLEPETATEDGRTVGAYQVPGTPDIGFNPDPASVFNGGSCNESWSGFSAHDVRAIIAVGGGVLYVL